MKFSNLSIACAAALATTVAVASDDVDLRDLYSGKKYRVTQDTVTTLSRDEARLAGLRMFTTPFRKADGYGDGDDNPPSPTEGSNHEGERGSIQGNGTFQRINGLDAQTCLECHSIISRRTVPMKFGIGGVGGVNNTVVGAGGATFVDLTTTDKKHNVNGRVINPPFIFGAGGVELLANEMTIELNDQLALADNDGTTQLSAKGISFGSVTKVGGVILTAPDTGEAIGVEGVFDAKPYVDGDPLHPNSDFLVVAPFGRKGDAKSTRTFDTGALSFHFGMQIGDHDNDSDGVSNEVTEGELSALSILVGTAQTPFTVPADDEAQRGLQLMNEFGCTECHVPSMDTNSKTLGFRFPEIGNDPAENVYYTVDLTQAPMNFEENGQGGITVPLFADLKRHYMGPSLEEASNDGMFTTMRLWGVADTAPYLHDGRALTIKEAIALHGADAESEAHFAVQAFVGSNKRDQNAVLAFLNTLRSPDGTFPDLQALAEGVAVAQGVKK